MPLNTFGWTDDAVTTDRAGNVKTGVELTVYADEDKTTQVTQLYADDGTTLLAKLLSDTEGRFGFKASDAYSLLYIFGGSSTRPYVLAAHEVLDAGSASVEAAAAAAQASATAAQNAANLVGAPADTAVNTLVTPGSGSATEATLNSTIATAVGAVAADAADALYSASAALGRAVRPPKVTGPTLTTGYAGTLPIEFHGGKLWGINGTNIQTSANDGATWTTVATAPAGSVERILWCADGEIVLTNGAQIWKSSGWAANPATATYASKVTKSAPAGVGILPWGIDGDGTKFIATEYSGTDRSESRYIWVSTDQGNNWAVVLDKYTIDPTNLSHMHGVCYDPWEDRFWVSHGHGTIRGMYYSGDNGTTWTKLGGAFQPDAAPCAMASTDDGIVLGSDSGDGGMYGIPRAPLARMEMRRTARWSVVEDGVTGFANRAYRDPNTGLVYVGFKSDFATVPSGVAAGTARTAAFIWADNPSISKSVNPLVTDSGALVAYMDRSGSFDLLAAQVLTPGTVGFDAGNVEGGTAVASTAVAAGAGASALAAARFGVAFGVGALSQNQAVTAVGYKAGTTSPSTATNTVHLGDSTYASTNGTAVGSAAQAVGDAIALGKGTVASQSFSENIGPRFRVRKRLAGDAHPAIPAVDEVQDYTIMVGSRLSSYHQTRDGRRVQVGNIGILATVTGINARTVAATALLTVPASATAVVTRILIRSTTATAITAAPTVGVGVAAGEDDLMPSTALTGLTVANKAWAYSPEGLLNVVTAGQVLSLGVDAASVGTTHTLAVDVLGYLL